MKKIPAPHEQKVFLLIMTLLMGLAISFVKTVQLSGFRSGFLMQWLSGFLSTYIIVVPAVLLIMPVARSIVKAIVAGKHS
jgi:hypothetical protein